jgi:nicotinate-nucleotide pyrophosphorylase (carboxylating)
MQHLPPYLSDEIINKFIESALAEDVGDGDHSSLGAVPADAFSQARLIVKDEGIIAGVDLALRIMAYIDSTLVTEVFITDGKKVKVGDIAFVVKGNAHAILKAERLLLNCMQRMSGIATYTNSLVKLIESTPTKLLDTRKTTPNFRICEKWAVLIGGGVNHRFGLYDQIILKDNHIDFSGGITAAVNNTVAYLEKIGKKLKIEVETRNLAEVQEALDTKKVDIIMLDNMPIPLLKQAVALIDKRAVTEASGGITEKTILSVAQTGVDFISVGALTHSFNSLDMSLKAF